MMNRSLRIALYLLIFFSVFNFTSAIMGASYVVGALGGSPEISTYGVTFFGLGNACMFVLGAEFSTRFGGLRSLFYATLFFIFTMYLTGAAPTFFVFNLARFLSGIASGIFFPISWTLLNEHPTEKQKHTMFALLGFIVSVTPVLGASYGGWLAYDLEWPWIFYSQIPILGVIAWILRKNTTPHLPGALKPFDLTGYIFFALFVLSGGTSITLAEQLDWYRSPLICFLWAICLVSLVFFILWSRVSEKPCFDLTLLKHPTLLLGLICLFFLFSAYFGMVILLSLWLHIDAQYTPLWISLLVAHMAIASALLCWTLHRWIEKMSSLWIVLLATLFFAISCFYSTDFNAEIDFFRLAIARTMAGFGLAFFYFPLLSACIKALPKERSQEGICIFQTVRLIAGSVGCIAYPTLWFVRRIFYHSRLGEQLTPYSELTQEYLSKLSFYGPKGLRSSAVLEKALNTQADALALADCFYFMGWIMVGVGILIFLYQIRKLFISKPITI